jgi:hypothetical protein
MKAHSGFQERISATPGIMEDRPLAVLKSLIGDKKFLVIDEAQTIKKHWHHPETYH